MSAYNVAIGPQEFKVQAVNGAEHHDLLIEMQKVCLPYDTPVDPATGFWWLAYNDKHEAVAFASLLPSEKEPGYAYLNRAGVVPGWRGRGLQKRLIRARLVRAKQLGMSICFSDTFNNPASANSLIACGFKSYTPAGPWGSDGTAYWIKRL